MTNRHVFGVTLALIAGGLLVPRTAFADAMVPIVAVIDFPLALLSIFWIAPVEALIIWRLEPDLSLRSLLWDLWLANWLSLAAGALVAGVAMTLALLGSSLGPHGGQSVLFLRALTFVTSASTQCSSTPWVSASLISLVWVAITLPITVIVERRFLEKRWHERGDLWVVSPLRAVLLANLASYAILILGLFRITVWPALNGFECASLGASEARGWHRTQHQT